MPPTVLLIGGHGKIAQLLTPLLLARSWNVTSLIRAQEQKSRIEELGHGQPGRLNVLVRSLEELGGVNGAEDVLKEVGAGWVVWCAGAGGRGGASRTIAIDQDAAIAFTKASVNNASVKKFLTVSYLGSRRNKPSWWSDQDWEAAQKVNNEVLPTYYKAKVAADEVLTVLANERYEREAKEGVPEKERFAGISLRPGTLTDEKAAGVSIGKTRAQGKISRGTVAEAIRAVLETDGAKGWIDLLDGEEGVAEGVKRVVKEGIDAVEGEDFEAQKERASKL